MNTHRTKAEEYMIDFIFGIGTLGVRYKHTHNKSLHCIFTPLHYVKTSEFRRWAAHRKRD
jgi:hypothetical protein